jgi:hypothetical protein
MGDLVNLRMVKKRRARAQEAEIADANRQLHGRTKLQRQSEAAIRRLAERVLDQAKLDSPVERDRSDAVEGAAIRTEADG